MGIAFGLGFAAGLWLFGGAQRPAQARTFVQSNDMFGLWSLDPDGYAPPDNYESIGYAWVSGRAPGGGSWASAPYTYELGMQAGYHPNVTAQPDGKVVLPLVPTWPVSSSRTLWEVFRPVGSTDPLAHRAWFVRSYLQRIADNKPTGTLTIEPARRPQTYWPSVELPWQFGQYPYLSPVSPMPGAQPGTPPLYRPRPQPWSPEAPAVGPSPGEFLEPYPVELPRPHPWPGAEPLPSPSPSPYPNPQPGPGVQPVPEILPELLPEIAWTPAPLTYGQTWPSIRPHARPRPNTRPHRARRPPRRTKETKAKAGPIFGFLWGSISPVTEMLDFLNILYECLPWVLKRDEYLKRDRQPNPKEKLELIYQHINDLDVSCALVGYTNNFIEDFLYSLGSGQIKKANKKNRRPIGYEAGGTLTGGGGGSFPSVDIESIGDFLGGLL